MRCWCGYLSGARCRLFAYGPADATAFPKPHHLLRSLNPDWLLPFWYRLTQVVLEKRPWNGRSSGSSCVLNADALIGYSNRFGANGGLARLTLIPLHSATALVRRPEKEPSKLTRCSDGATSDIRCTDLATDTGSRYMNRHLLDGNRSLQTNTNLLELELNDSGTPVSRPVYLISAANS